MDQWSKEWAMREDRPYTRPQGSSSPWWAFALGVALLGGGAALYYFWPRGEAPAPIRPAAPAVEQPAPQASAEPGIRHPLETPSAEASKGLPSLENSDSMMRDALTSLLGAKSFAELVYPAELVRRIVATVDNLPRKTAPSRMLPWQPVPGGFVTLGEGDQAVIAARNAARYEPYVRVVQGIDTRALVRRYIDSYPLFQQAYEQLGYPNQYFTDRLIEAIDDLLAAPEPPMAPKLEQPKVRYTFADPELESLSAGQKIMVRVGRENEAKLKAKLREVRAELLAARPR
jgi:hypothetical protein